MATPTAVSVVAEKRRLLLFVSDSDESRGGTAIWCGSVAVGLCVYDERESETGKDAGLSEGGAGLQDGGRSVVAEKGQGHNGRSLLLVRYREQREADGQGGAVGRRRRLRGWTTTAAVVLHRQWRRRQEDGRTTAPADAGSSRSGTGERG